MFRSPVGNYLLRFYSLASNPSIPKEIKLPKKIYRTESSVLKSLISCVEPEAGSSQYFLIDDPSLFPRDYNIRHLCSLSKASGRSSARYAFKQISHDFIKLAKDVPKINVLQPLQSCEYIEKKVKDGKYTVDEALRLMIKLIKPNEAYAFYSSNDKSDVLIETKRMLLELLCAVGDMEINFDIPYEELYYKEMPVKLWRLDMNAELLFNEIENKTPEMYEAMIRGAAKFNNVSRAFQLFDELKEKNVDYTLSLQTYNALLRSLHFNDDLDMKVKGLVINLFREMQQKSIKPTVITFNNAIFAFVKRKDVKFAQKIFAEMLFLRIEPTFGTFSLLLNCQFPINYMIVIAREILEILESRMQIIQYEETHSSDDFGLFPTMVAIFRRCKDVESAIRLNRVLINGGRFHLLGNETNRGRYFDNFFKLLAYTSYDLSETLRLIRLFVPKFYIFQLSTISVILNRIVEENRVDLLPFMMDSINWTQEKNMKVDTFPKICRVLLSASDEDLYLNANVRDKLIKSFERLFEICRLRQPSILSFGDNMKAVIEILRKLGDEDLLWNAIVTGHTQKVLTPNCVEFLIEDFVEKNQFDRIIELLEFLEERLVTIDTVGELTCEWESLKRIVELCQLRILPSFEHFNLNTGNLTKIVKKLQKSIGDINFDSFSSGTESNSDSSSDDD